MFCSLQVQAKNDALNTQSQAQEILREGLDLAADQETAMTARKSLEGRPRASIIAAARTELLNHPEHLGSFALIDGMALKELVPDLIKQVSKTSDWHVARTLASLSSDADRRVLSPIYLKRLLETKDQATLKVAMLDSLAEWNQALPYATYKLLIGHPSYEVREAVVRQFLLTRKLYSQQDMQNRFITALATKPYQVRLEAMRAFAEMPAIEKSKLNLLKASLKCAAEPNEIVKQYCQTSMGQQ
jgi:hypothetical protein